MSRDAVQHESRAAVATIAGKQARYLELGWKVAHHCGVPTEHHVALTGAVPAAGLVGSNDQIVYTITVDVAGRTHVGTHVLLTIDSVQHESRAAVAAGDGQEAAEREQRREVARLLRVPAEHDIALARLGLARAEMRRADDHIVDPIPVHVARRADRVTRSII